MNFLSQMNAAPSGQVTLKPEVLSLTSTREIDGLIGELKFLRAKIASDGSRAQHLLREYTELNQSVIQLTKIICDGLIHLKTLPVLPKSSVLRTTQNGTLRNIMSNDSPHGELRTGSLRSPAHRPTVLCIGR